LELPAQREQKRKERTHGYEKGARYSISRLRVFMKFPRGAMGVGSRRSRVLPARLRPQHRSQQALSISGNSEFKWSSAIRFDEDHLIKDDIITG